MNEESFDFFPSSPRVIYQRNPLKEVICQLRFPPLLKIDGDSPAEFQEKVRGAFPYFERSSAIGLPEGLPPELLQIMAGGPGGKSYKFITDDRNYALELSQSSISLTSKNYSHWEEFKKFLNVGISALLETYNPSFFTRVGLRYVNSISRAGLGLEGEKWSSLLRTELLGELSIPLFEDNATATLRVIQVQLEGAATKITFQHGYGNAAPSGDMPYVVDIDVFNEEKINTDGIANLLDSFNQQIGCGFRWCLSERLHHALEPK